MGCTQTDVSTGYMTGLPTPGNISSASRSGSRRLMFSDSPETLNSEVFSTANITLWHDYMNTSSTSVMHRVYGWHLNSYGASIKVGLTVQNLSSTNTIELQQVYREKQTSTNYLSTGICLAKACLGGTMVSISPADNRFGQTVGLIEETTVANNYLFGFVYEFTVARYSGSGNLNYKIRTVATRTTSNNLRSITSNPVNPDSNPPHPRGSWAQGALITGTLPTYTVGTTASTNISNGSTDNVLSASASYDSGNARDNTGHWGAIYRVTLPITNNTGTTKTVRIRLNARAEDYGGAVKRSSGTNGVPRLLVNADPNVAHVMDFSAPAGSSSTQFDVMHAGAASLAVAVYVTTI